MTEAEMLQVPTGDGRTLEVLTAGDPGGFPYLFNNGSPSAVASYPWMEERIRAAGLRMISFSRPGYGGSPPRPAAGRFVDDLVDMVAVLDHLGVGEFVTAGFSGGGPRSLACAALLPDRCRAAATVGGVAPMDAEGLDWFAGMAPENVAEYHAALEGPQAYEAFLAEALKPVFAATPGELAAAFGELVPPVDQAALTGEMADWFSRVMHQAGAQGVVGARDDGLAAVSPWGFDLAAITVPVSIWQGRLDAMVPFAHGAWLAEHVPGARTHLLDEDGHLSLISRIEEILAELKELGGVG